MYVPFYVHEYVKTMCVIIIYIFNVCKCVITINIYIYIFKCRYTCIHLITPTFICYRGQSAPGWPAEAEAALPCRHSDPKIAVGNQRNDGKNDGKIMGKPMISINLHSF